MGAICGHHGRRLDASTGPRSIERGMMSNRVHIQRTRFTLQRGRAQLSAEWLHGRPKAAAMERLQRGRAQLSAEWKRGCQRGKAEGWLQRGRAQLSAECFNPSIERTFIQWLQRGRAQLSAEWPSNCGSKKSLFTLQR